MTLSRGICSEPIPIIIMTSKVPSSQESSRRSQSRKQRWQRQLKHVDRETHQQTRRKEGGKNT